MDETLNKDHLFSALESILFAHGEPLKLEKLASLMGLELMELEDLAREYGEKLSQNLGSGLVLLKNHDEIQLGTRPENFIFLEKFLKRDLEEDMSPAVIEVLTLVLYRGPILRSEIDFVRGVNSSYILRILAMRGLIVREKHGLSFVYRPSFELLKWLGIQNASDLPDFAVLNQRLEDLMKKTDTEKSPSEEKYESE